MKCIENILIYIENLNLKTIDNFNLKTIDNILAGINQNFKVDLVDSSTNDTENDLDNKFLDFIRNNFYSLKHFIKNDFKNSLNYIKKDLDKNNFENIKIYLIENLLNDIKYNARKFLGKINNFENLENLIKIEYVNNYINFIDNILYDKNDLDDNYDFYNENDLEYYLDDN
jgi:hypothetical protein